MSKAIDWRRLTAVFERIPCVSAAWVFGSAQHGIQKNGSELDVGVKFLTTPNLDTLADLRAALQSALQIEEIDLSILNQASSILRWEAIHGKRVFVRDPGQMAEFSSLTAREYEDDMAFLA